MLADKTSTTYVAGHRGLAGSAIWRRLEADGWTDLVGRSSKEVDLRDRDATRRLFDEIQPTTVVVAAARVGGILANDTYPAEFLSENLRIQVNLMDAALEHGVDRLLFLGSSCIYPRLAPQPIKEEYLLTGHLEQTNEAYAIAKIAGIIQVQSVRREYGKHWISAMPTNLYGPGDNFTAQTSHVLPALIRRYVEATESGAPEVVNWGSGSPLREFLHVDDLASAVSFLLEHYDDPSTINVGTGEDHSIRHIASLVAAAAGYAGETTWDTTRPDGTPRKLLDVTRLRELGWEPSVSLEAGIGATVDWYLEHRAQARS
ncbi:GDP-L-fucose synthase family protein [Cellulomonas citrea]|uniref:GDP-L-fucose synthase family protein n=1 Tax=Cellulomonas citrea TaxID=1909423 RepID=UPI00135C1595|nr:GDP-L-fucose synthase [Cellulomonas citrea]